MPRRVEFIQLNFDRPVMALGSGETVTAMTQTEPSSRYWEITALHASLVRLPRVICEGKIYADTLSLKTGEEWSAEKNNCSIEVFV